MSETPAEAACQQDSADVLARACVGTLLPIGEHVPSKYGLDDNLQALGLNIRDSWWGAFGLKLRAGLSIRELWEQVRKQFAIVDNFNSSEVVVAPISMQFVGLVAHLPQERTATPPPYGECWAMLKGTSAIDELYKMVALTMTQSEQEANRKAGEAMINILSINANGDVMGGLVMYPIQCLLPLAEELYLVASTSPLRTVRVPAEMADTIAAELEKRLAPVAGFDNNFNAAAALADCVKTMLRTRHE